MERLYDLYLYRVQNPDSFIRLASISSKTANDIVQNWWDADDNNDCMIIELGDNPFLFDDVDIVDATLENLEEVISGW